MDRMIWKDVYRVSTIKKILLKATINMYFMCSAVRLVIEVTYNVAIKTFRRDSLNYSYCEF